MQGNTRLGTADTNDRYALRQKQREPLRFRHLAGRPAYGRNESVAGASIALENG